MMLVSGVPDLHRGALLIVGPRYESEIYFARAVGWPRRGVRAVDLLTYSRLVDQGDMHALPYKDGSFDAVICGWTLSYSTDPARAASEMARVLKKDGVLGIGVEVYWGTDSPEDLPDVLVGPDRVQTTKQLQALFADFDVLAGFEPAISGDDTWILRRRPA